jgi:DeoR/GlpR family transcriptional regulator of sugar metabolism
MLREERHRLIRRHVEEFEQATVTELSAMFEVSEATIRRDLEELDARGWVHRTHGGAMTVQRAEKEPPLLDRMDEQAEEKRRIGSAAAELIEDGDTIFLSSGTTVLEVAHHLRGRRDLTVMTNSLSVVNELAANVPDATIIVLGGSLRPSEMSLIGHITEQNLRDLRANKLIMGMRAIDIEQGMTNDYLPETMTDRAILEIAQQVIIVADHTKFGRVSTVFVAPVTAAHIIVTDSGLASDTIAGLEELGIQIVVA